MSIPVVTFAVLFSLFLMLSCAGLVWLVAFFCRQQEARISFTGACGVTILMGVFSVASDHLLDSYIGGWRYPVEFVADVLAIWGVLRLTFIRAFFAAVLFWVILFTVVFFVLSRIDIWRSAPNKSLQPIPINGIGTCSGLGGALGISRSRLWSSLRDPDVVYRELFYPPKGAADKCCSSRVAEL